MRVSIKVASAVDIIVRIDEDNNHFAVGVGDDHDIVVIHAIAHCGASRQGIAGLIVILGVLLENGAFISFLVLGIDTDDLIIVGQCQAQFLSVGFLCLRSNQFVIGIQDTVGDDDQVAAVHRIQLGNQGLAFRIGNHIIKRISGGSVDYPSISRSNRVGSLGVEVLDLDKVALLNLQDTCAGYADVDGLFTVPNRDGAVIFHSGSIAYNITVQVIAASAFHILAQIDGEGQQIAVGVFSGVDSFTSASIVFGSSQFLISQRIDSIGRPLIAIFRKATAPEVVSLVVALPPSGV